MARSKVSKQRKKGIDLSLFTIMSVMIAFGLIMVFSASSPTSFYRDGDQFYIIKRQLLWTVLGYAAMTVTSCINYKTVKKWAGVFCLISFILIIIVPFVGISRGDARRWLGVGSLQFQPSEVAKFALIFYFAKRISERPKNHLNSFVQGLMPYMLILGAFLGGLILQDHLSGAVIIFLSLMIVLFAGGAQISHFIAMGAIGLGALAPFAYFERYRLNRLLAFIDPFADKQGIGWQIVQGLYAIGSGGLFGRGLGQSRQKFLYVPEAHNDYIYAILCEELGFAGAIIVALLFAAFITRGIIIAIRAPDTFSSLTVFGIISLIGLQYIINLGVVTATLPNTGMQLPFFSAGGSSLVFIMAAMGVVFNISMYTEKSSGKNAVFPVRKGIAK